MAVMPNHPEQTKACRAKQLSFAGGQNQLEIVGVTKENVTVIGVRGDTEVLPTRPVNHLNDETKERICAAIAAC